MSEPARTASIRGEVLELDTRVAVPRAVVTIKATGGGIVATVRTDQRGVFEATSLPAGTFVVQATKRGYLGYGETRARRESRQVVSTTDGVATDDVTLFVGRTAAVFGRVYDEFGEPVADAQMVVFRERPLRGRRSWALVRGPVASNDLGEYRIAGLDPGTYLVRAMPREARDPSLPAEFMPAPTYYPGTPVRDEAQRVVLVAGQEQIAHFPVVRFPTVAVSGAVFDAGGQPVAGARVNLMHVVRGPGFMSSASVDGPSSDTTAADGSFRIKDVPPGDYEIRAVTAATSSAGYNEADDARLDLVVAGEPISGISLTVSRGVPVTGRVVFDPPLRDDPPVLTVTAFRDAFSQREVATVDPDGTFTFKAWKGDRALRLGTTGGASAQRWAIATVRSSNRDLGFAFIDTATAIAGLEVVVTNRLGTVKGLVSGFDARADYSAVLFPDDADAWHPESPLLRTVKVTAAGTFTLPAVLAGRYRVMVVDGVSAQVESWFDVDWLSRARNLATVVDVGTGEATAVELKPVEVPEG